MFKIEESLQKRLYISIFASFNKLLTHIYFYGLCMYWDFKFENKKENNYAENYTPPPVFLYELHRLKMQACLS